MLSDKAFEKLQQIPERPGEVRQFEEQYRAYKALQEEKANATEAEYIELLDQDLNNLASEVATLFDTMVDTLLPEDPDESKEKVVVEIRAGAGGTEAGLFAADLFDMYQKYSARQQWAWEEVDQSNDLVAMLRGRGAYRALRHEIGVHRVQRVPTTDTSGRIHTSTATVAVLPEAKDVDVAIIPKDLRIEVCKAQGAGGQHVNTTDSAVRITHIPTGLTVFIQDDRSQHKNKARAMEILRARLYELEKRKAEEQRDSQRSQQVGGGQRHERIRTYNWPSSRVKDHRTDFVVNDLDGMLAGGPPLDDLLENLDEWMALTRKTELIQRIVSGTLNEK